jgi:hypothetical protein
MDSQNNILIALHHSSLYNNNSNNSIQFNSIQFIYVQNLTATGQLQS